MLVLSRRIGEEIVIGGNIHVTVLAVNGNRVRLGITAPASIPVARLELLAECFGAAANGARSGSLGGSADSIKTVKETTPSGRTLTHTSTEKVAAGPDDVAASG
jgi:carbon storage regulator